ncbi:MAG: PqqD family protein [Gammaproteobacteria bacterium]|nr:PqqD family protein [Gammaproteobacteria bacterium]
MLRALYSPPLIQLLGWAAMHPNHVPVPDTDYRLETFGDEVLLYHPAHTRTVYLNHAASLIWRLCDGTRTVAEIITLLRDSYPESADTIESDVESVLNQFAEHGAVHLKREAE